MLKRIKQFLFPSPSAELAKLYVSPSWRRVTREEVLTVRALTAYADGASPSVAMAIFRGERL